MLRSPHYTARLSAESRLLLVQQRSASSSAMRLLHPPLLTLCSPILHPCATLAGVRRPLSTGLSRARPGLQQQGSDAAAPWPGTVWLSLVEQPAPSTLTTVPGHCRCWSLTMGAPRWPTRAGLGGSWFSSMMQGEVIPRGARYSAITTTQYTSSRNTLRPAGRDRLEV